MVWFEKTLTLCGVSTLLTLTFFSLQPVQKSAHP